ncbi:PilT protein domain protein [Leptolyngbya sp. NIES-3755]|nr:PilT protein domain protein [Leptolyngbya sp. NIES-3755]
MKYVVDTHALLWFLQDDSRLGSNADLVLSDAGSQLVLPAIALAEAAWIVDRGKTSIPSARDVLTAIGRDPRFVIYPLTALVVEKSLGLVEINEMHDRQIVATALVLQDQGESVSLLTLDQNMTASGLINVIW